MSTKQHFYTKRSVDGGILGIQVVLRGLDGRKGFTQSPEILPPQTSSIHFYQTKPKEEQRIVFLWFLRIGKIAVRGGLATEALLVGVDHCAHWR